MHSSYFEKVQAMVEPGGVLFVNSSMGELGQPREDISIVAMPAGQLATDLGAPIASSLLALGAFSVHTELVPVAALVDAMPSLIPSYRSDLLDANRRAILAGAEYARETIMANVGAGS